MASLSQSFCVPEPRKFEKYETFIAKKPLRPLRQFQFDWFSRQKATVEKGSTGQITTA
jgi:hypothetical protein